jgi:hypothetical protein
MRIYRDKRVNDSSPMKPHAEIEIVSVPVYPQRVSPGREEVAANGLRFMFYGSWFSKTRQHIVLRPNIHRPAFVLDFDDGV